MCCFDFVPLGVGRFRAHANLVFIDREAISPVHRHALFAGNGAICKKIQRKLFPPSTAIFGVVLSFVFVCSVANDCVNGNIGEDVARIDVNSSHLFESGYLLIEIDLQLWEKTSLT